MCVCVCVNGEYIYIIRDRMSAHYNICTCMCSTCTCACTCTCMCKSMLLMSVWVAESEGEKELFRPTTDTHILNNGTLCHVTKLTIIMTTTTATARTTNTFCIGQKKIEHCMVKGRQAQNHPLFWAILCFSESKEGKA